MEPSEQENFFVYLSNRRSQLRLRALTNRMYHQERQRIFDFRDGIVKVIAILAGSVAFASIADPVIVKFCAGAITFSSAASLVFGFGSKSRDSSKRSTEWALLDRDMEGVGERCFSEEQLNQWAARASEIEAGEAAPHTGLLDRCYLRACHAMGSTPHEEKDLGLWPWLNRVVIFIRRFRPIIILH